MGKEEGGQLELDGDENGKLEQMDFIFYISYC